MKYKIIQTLSIILIILNLTCLSGCIQKNDRFDKEDDTNTSNLIFDEIEISEYHISTNWITGCCGNFENETRPGFYHKIPMWSNASYKIEGKIKNIGKEKISRILINISFYDDTKTKLFDLNYLKKSITLKNLSSKELKKFSVSICVSDYYNVNRSDTFDKSFAIFHRVESLSFSVSYTN